MPQGRSCQPRPQAGGSLGLGAGRPERSGGRRAARSGRSSPPLPFEASCRTHRHPTVGINVPSRFPRSPWPLRPRSSATPGPCRSPSGPAGANSAGESCHGAADSPGCRRRRCGVHAGRGGACSSVQRRAAARCVAFAARDRGRLPPQRPLHPGQLLPHTDTALSHMHPQAPRLTAAGDRRRRRQPPPRWRRPLRPNWWSGQR